MAAHVIRERVAILERVLHAALRETLGTHVKQAGSLVAPDRLRFDFSHFAGVDAVELTDIEQQVNEQIRLNNEIVTDVTTLDNALASGALAFFGDRYPEQNVRVVTVADAGSPRGFYSKELCGGTHTRRTGQIGVFKVAVEQSVAAGTRRIEALTGEGALADYQQARQALAEVAARLHVGEDGVSAALERLAQAQKQIEKQLETEVVCVNCTLRYSVYGVFAFCPDCGQHNSLQILDKNLDEPSANFIYEALLAFKIEHSLAKEQILRGRQLVKEAASARRPGARSRSTMMFTRVLVANRGEIALRVLRTCRELGVRAVIAHSKADAHSLPVRLADESICVGPHDPRSSYLNIPSIISAAVVTDSEAIHPGYGFLAENPAFADICRACGITFIGPSPEAIRLMGDKAQARVIARQAGVPVVPGSQLPIKHEAEAVEVAGEAGYPVILKAAAGGGGRGMRIVRERAGGESGVGFVRSINPVRASSAVMVEQLRHLGEVSHRPNVDMAIVPSSELVGASPVNIFVVYDERLVTVEIFSGSVALRDYRDIKYHLNVFDYFRERAVSENDARRLLSSVADEFMRGPD